MNERIPREFIESLISKIDIVDSIDNRVPLLKKTGSNYFACCPFHQEKSPSFSVSQTKQFFYCFGCGAHGNVIDFFMQFDRLSFPEAVELLAKQIGMEIPKESAPKKINSSLNNLYELLQQVAHYYQTQLRNNTHVIDYLKKRGISGTIARDFLFGFAPEGWENLINNFENQVLKGLLETGMIIKKEDGSYFDRFRNRIMFPIHNKRGQIIGFGGRIIDKGEPKYLNSPETIIFQKGSELYGLYQAIQHNRQLKKVIIVEGYMDVVALFQHGITYAVATLGTATTSQHLHKLFRYTSEIVFCFDGDNAGRLAAWRALQITLSIITDGMQIRFMFLPENEDPDSLIRKEGREAFEARMKNALSISECFFQHIAKEVDLNSTDGRARFVKLAMESIQKIPDSIFKKMMLDELAHKSRIDVRQLSNSKIINTEKITKTSSRFQHPSAIRLAIALLLQTPSLINFLNEPLPKISLPGLDILNKIIEIIRKNPHISSAGILEFWRNQKEMKYLAILLAQEHMIPEEGITQEFLGSIERIKNFALKQSIEDLLAKAALSGLSQEEKILLQDLVQNK